MQFSDGGPKKWGLRPARLRRGNWGGQDGPRRPKTPGPISSHFGSGSCQSVRLSFFGTMEPMAQADQALSFFTKFELYCYETLKTKQENLSSCRKELRKLSRRIIGGYKNLSADTLEAKETFKEDLKTDITKIAKRVKRAFGKAYYRIRSIKNSVPTSRSQCSSNRIGCRETQKEKGCLLRSRREPGLQQGNTKRKRQLH